ncbi:hypothetical protein KP79_PYT06501 [Mizuhopecten yessoensis]|uniref:Uncharacterized protein n=1 Tax=Mizuhopecten yessoensis TaxID=6573 RepID=A0A210PUA2_MIZYE|nr:hypothetical protein KP79_PYT06501 [Mizuhopecten yessoensis]
MTILSLRPSEIRYSQDSIAYYFGYGRYSGTQIGQTLDDILQGKCNVRDIPTITVSSRDGLWYSGDNRRLWVFRKCEELGIIDRVPAAEGYINSSKFTTYNRGVSIRVRGSPGGQFWTQRYRKDLVIKEPEPPKPVEPPTRVINIAPIHEYVVHPPVQGNVNLSHPELSEDLSDIASDSDQSVELEPTQSRECSEGGDSCLQNISADVKNRTEGQANPTFVGDEDDQDQQHVTEVKDLGSEDDIPSQTSPDDLVHSNNGNVSVDLSSSEGGLISCDQPASEDVHHNITLEIDTNHLTASTEPKDYVDVELGHKVREPCQTNMSANFVTFLSKYRCQCLILLTIAFVIFVIFLLIGLLVPL